MKSDFDEGEIEIIELDIHRIMEISSNPIELNYLTKLLKSLQKINEESNPGYDGIQEILYPNKDDNYED